MAIIDPNSPRKAYISVALLTDPEGRIRPTHIIWDDAHTYEVDRVTDVRQAASFKAGGVGTRYTCMVRGRERYLFQDEQGRWFVERTQ